MNWWALTVAGLVAGAASAETWREYKTAHFILDTDASGAQAESMISALEKARAADLAVLVGGDVELPGHVRIIAPASRGLFLELAGDWTTALYTLGPYQEPVVLAPVAGFVDDPEVAAHELAHAISRYLFPEQRHWFSEGLAEFVQTVAARRTETGSTASTHIAHDVSMGAAAGAVPAGYGAWLSQSDLAVRSADLLTWNGVEDKALWGRYHAASWLLYHYLWNKRGKDLAELQKQLLDGATWTKAWQVSFPGLDPQKPEQMNALDTALFDYTRSGRFVMAKVDVKPDYKLTQQPVSQADMRLWLLRLRQEWPQKQGERVAMIRAQLESAACNSKLAWQLMTAGRAKEALQYANRALDLAPWDPKAVDTLAEIAFQLGQRPQALQLRARAAAMQLDQAEKAVGWRRPG